MDNLETRLLDKLNNRLIYAQYDQKNDRYEHGPSYTVGFYQVMELDESKPLVESVAELELEVKDLMKKYIHNQT